MAKSCPNPSCYLDGILQQEHQVVGQSKGADLQGKPLQVRRGVCWEDRVWRLLPTASTHPRPTRVGYWNQDKYCLEPRPQMGLIPLLSPRIWSLRQERRGKQG